MIPIDFLPVDEIDIRDVNENMFWNYGRKIIAAAKWCRSHPKFHMIYINQFQVRPGLLRRDTSSRGLRVPRT